jgi:hypothetical protein
MTITAYSYLRGHRIYWDFSIKDWRYLDNDAIAEDNRPCIKCGHLPTPEGYDFCLGKIRGAKSACCGHGIYQGSVLYKNGKNKDLNRT